MRILHCCLAAFYIDHYSYQENILPKMHKLQGHEVAILASTETYLSNTALGYLPPSTYINEDGIPVTRVSYQKWLPFSVMKKLRIYKGISAVIEDFRPDIIFIHDCQFISITKIVAYIRQHHAVKVYVDGHTDFINSAKNWLSREVLHRIIYKWCAKQIEPYTRKFYGVLPVRVDFFKDVYNIAPEKVELLLLGADHSLTDLNNRDAIRERVRQEHQIDTNDFVLVTGGKLDNRKKIHTLMRAVNELQVKDIKLIVFGTPNSEMKSEIDELSRSAYIRFIGWANASQTYDYLLAADLAFFPGTHSVLWEQSVGVGLPCVFKRWNGIEHVDLDGNCLFIDNGDLMEIKKMILLLYNDRSLLMSMKKVASDRGIKEFSYYEIAKKAIES